MKLLDGIYNAVLSGEKIDNEDYREYVGKIDDCIDHLNEILSMQDFDVLTQLLYYSEKCNEIEKYESFKEGIHFGAELNAVM